MNHWRTRGLSFLLALCLMLSLSIPTFAASAEDTVSSAVTESAAYMLKAVANPQVGSIGGEWAVIGLARSGYDVPQSYWDNYYETVEEYVTACKGNLHDKKYTEYSRLIVALTAIGADPTDVAGYNLLTALGDYDKTIWQGLNGPIWALIALDSGNYEMPVNPDAKTQATRQMYIDRILECQLPDGGWSLFGGTETATAGYDTSDPDITGMALQALAKYQNQPAVAKATEEALACMSQMQSSDGGFSSWGTPNSESTVQMLVALCELGISLDDARFVKSGNTVLDNLLTFRQSDGSFLHTKSGSGSNQMASEQGFYALVAAQRAMDGKSSLYRMDDVTIRVTSSTGTSTVGLPGKDAAVQKQPVTAPGTTFEDIAAHANQPAVEALAARGILNGKDDDLFHPDATMTRAEFAATVVRALGLTPKAVSKFSDVASSAWYAGYVGTAYTYGIVNGKSETTFDPSGTISRQEAALMVTRAAKLCGMDTAMDAASVRDVLAQFSDYVKTAEWAREGLAFCYQEGILDDSALEIQGTVAIKRCEIAQMIFNLLGSAELL